MESSFMKNVRKLKAARKMYDKVGRMISDSYGNKDLFQFLLQKRRYYLQVLIRYIELINPR